MAKQVKEQVERIVDEGTGNRRSVIVRMASSEKEIEPLLRTASEVIYKRNLALTARDVLPASLDKMHVPTSGKGSIRTRRQLKALDKSVASQIAVTGVTAVSRVALRTAGLEVLEPLLDSDLVQKAVAEAFKPKTKGSKAKPKVPTFWTSKCVLLNMSKDDLVKLPAEVSQIQGIYPNRTLRLPPLVETQRLPVNVQENKASSWGIHAIGALASWGAYGARGKGIRVGLLDTGVDASHPDLAGKVVAWAEFDTDGLEVDGSQPHDTDEHGTHCAGTILGGNVSGQWIGVAPEAELAAALVLDGNEGGTDAQVLAGIQWAAEQGVDVVSMSLGGLWLGPEVPDFYTEAILSCLRLGIPVVTAIGNSGHQTTDIPGNDFFAFSVGATDPEDRVAGFSGGRTHFIEESDYLPPSALPLVYSKPDVSAPGVAIKSSTPRGRWKTFNGTSMATPHVAGAIALLLSATSIRESVDPYQRAFLLQDLLIGSVEELGESGQDHRYGFGRIDVLRAIGFAKELEY